MKKADLIRELKSLGEKPASGRKVSDLRKDLANAQADASKPGHNIGTAQKHPGDRVS